MTSTRKEMATQLGTSRLVLYGAVAGVGFGIADFLDPLLGDFARDLSGTSLVWLLCFSVLLHAAFGALVGRLWGALLRWGQKMGITWHADDGLLWQRLRLRLSPQRMLVVVGVWLLILLSGFTALCLGNFPFGMPYLHLAATVGPAMCLLIAIGAKLSPTSRCARLLLWSLFIAGYYWLQSRLIFQVSRDDPMNYLHALGMVQLYFVAILALSMEAARSNLRFIELPKRAVVGSCLVAAMFLLTARPLLSLGSHQDRLVIHERTSLSYRLLWLLPDILDHSVSTEERQAICPAPATFNAPPAQTPDQAAARGVVLIFIDTLRADRLGARRSDGTPLTPRMSQFAEGATQFSNAYTTAPSTRRVSRSLVTGKFNAGSGKDEAGPDTLGYLLRDGGIKTSALAAHRNLGFSMHMFDTYTEFLEEAGHRRSLSSPTSAKLAIEELQKFAPDEPFLMLAHYYDPHRHYVPNDMFDFGDSVIERYEAEVAYTDHWVGELLDELDHNPAYQDVAVIIMGDHGDEFWEHRYRHHLLKVYNESMKVPLIIRLPGAPAGQVFDTSVSIADLYPTLLDIFALESPVQTLGRSLLPAAQAKAPPPDRPIFMLSHYERIVAAVSGDKKILVNRDIATNEYYDLAVDPKEEHNLADEEPEEFQELYCALLAWMEEQAF